MKIEDHNKKLFLARMLARTGGSVKRRYSKHIPESAKDYMKYKPYGGNYGKDKSDKSIARDTQSTDELENTCRA